MDQSRELFIANAVVLAARAWANRRPTPHGVTNRASLDAREELRFVLRSAEEHARSAWNNREPLERVIGPSAGVTPITAEHADAIRAAFPNRDVVVVRPKGPEEK